MKKIALFIACCLIPAAAGAAAVRPSMGENVRPGIARSGSFKFGPVSSSTSDIPTSGLLAWYKADAITGFTNGQKLTSWLDSSGNGHDLTSAHGSNDTGILVEFSTPTYQTNQQNSLPGVMFSFYASSSDAMSSTNSTSSTGEGTFFAVVAITTSVGSTGLVAGLHSAADPYSLNFGLQYYFVAGPPPVAPALGAMYDGGGFGGLAATQNVAYTIATCAGPSSDQLFYSNGVQLLDPATVPLSTEYGAITIFAPQSPMKFRMYEMIVYSRQMGASEMESVMSYLRTKWGHY